MIKLEIILENLINYKFVNSFADLIYCQVILLVWSLLFAWSICFDSINKSKNEIIEHQIFLMISSKCLFFSSMDEVFNPTWEIYCL